MYKKKKWADFNGPHITGEYSTKWANSTNFTGQYANQTGGATNDYTYNPPGVNPNYTQYIVSAGIGPNGDPLSSAPIKAATGNNFGNFWKLVFPQGTNDCDLQAAINNITAKIQQYQGLQNYSPGGMVGWAKANLYATTKQQQAAGASTTMGLQGDAVAVVNTSVSTLQTILSQYTNIYQQHSNAGGGCQNGLLTAINTGIVTANAQSNQLLASNQAAVNQSIANAVPQAQAAAASSEIVAQAAAAEAPIQGTAAGVAATNATAGISPITIGLVIGGILLAGVVVTLVFKKKKLPVTTAAT